LTYNEVVKIGESFLLPMVWELYELEGYTFTHIERDYIAPNVVYYCDKNDSESRILRIAFRSDRNMDDYLGETEFIRYLHENGGSVANVICSRMGNMVEEITHDKHTFFVCLFEQAKGKLLVENHYQYREGVPIAEYYYDCGKVLGKLHQLSKVYTPIHRRCSFLDRFTAEYIDTLIPNSLSHCKEKMFSLLQTLKETDQSREVFGMIHCDFNDGNYNIDFETGQITVFDFDNSCFGWYMFDLASLWQHGIGWAQNEPDANKRKQAMNSYFETVIAGYRSETAIDDEVLENLPLFLQVSLMEEIIAAFEDMWNSGGVVECDEELSYLIKCLEDDISYKGFYHEIFSCDKPFEYELRDI